MKFKNVDYRSLEGLYSICKDSSQNEFDFVCYLYNSQFTNFKENLAIAKLLGLINEKGNKLFCFSSFDDFKSLIIKKLIENKFSLGTLGEMLSKFIFDGNEYIYNISNQERVALKWERYFLSDLGMISTKDDRIIFDAKFADLLVNKQVSLSDLKKYNKQKEILGELAEQFVLKYELNQLKKFPLLPKENIRQISFDFANAGYDIESFDKKSALHSVYEKIFIEVKCVNKDYLFYWSKNEIDKAEQIRTKYFLYLVPSTLNEVDLRIIQDPFTNVLKNKSWSYEIERLCVRKNHLV
ncbi:MAG: DUF3883 domain-containing protein [Clostridiales Family XIII bacterium]|jgi:hypothetical protein|nr:DUF3883 domain-containing protein [Clostridiales Family XIII bacterium]